MRVLVWNMNKQQRAWHWLRRNAERFDVALLQETRDPRAWAGPEFGSVVWRPMRGAPGSRRTLWGSAIVARTLELEAFTPDERFPWLRVLGGSVTIARCAGSPVWLASVHFHASQVPYELLDAHPWADVSLSTPDGSVWEADLIPHELHRLFGEETFLWGGDLNSAEVMDDRGFVGGNRKLRGIWRAAGSYDLRLRFFAEEQQTFFARNRRDYQLDHVFADAQTEARLRNWRIELEPVSTVPPVSDHAPILVEIE